MKYKIKISENAINTLKILMIANSLIMFEWRKSKHFKGYIGFMFGLFKESIYNKFQ